MDRLHLEKSYIIAKSSCYFGIKVKRCGSTKELHCFNRLTLLIASNLEKKLKDAKTKSGSQRSGDQKN